MNKSNSSEVNTQQDMILDIAEQIFAEQLSPTLIVNEDLEIIKAYGHIAQFCQKTVKTPSQNTIGELLLPTVAEHIIQGIEETKRLEHSFVKSSIFSADNNFYYNIEVTLNELSSAAKKLIFIVIIDFEDEAQEDFYYEINSQVEDARSDYARLLQKELDDTRSQLKVAAMEMNTVTSQLNTINEEQLTANEELQGTNEELQSVNEELYTLNSEFQQKINELTLLNADLDNFIKSTKVAAIFLDKSLRIRRYTLPFSKYINILPVDHNRSFLDLKMSYDFKDLDENLYASLNEGQPHEGKLDLGFGKIAIYKVIPYIGNNHQIDGLVVMVYEEEEINRVLSEVDDMNLEREWLHWLNYVAGWSYLFEEQKIVFTGDNNLGFPNSLEIIEFYRHIPERFREEYIRKFENCLSDGGEFDFEHQIYNERGEIRYVTTRVFRQEDAEGELVKLFGIIQDNTGRIQDQENIKYLEQCFNNIFNSMPMPVLIVNRSKKIKYFNRAASELFGYSELDLPLLTFSSLRVETERPNAFDVFDKFLNNELDSIARNCNYLKRSGEVFSAHTKTSRLPTFDPEKRFLFVMLFPFDTCEVSNEIQCQFIPDPSQQSGLKMLSTPLAD